MNQPVDRQVGTCPDVEDIASYLDGQVGGAERAALQAHFADCERCQELLAEVHHTLDGELAGSSPAAPVRRRLGVWRWAVPLVAAAAVVLLAVRLYPERSGVSPELRAVVAAAGSFRPVTARLTGGFPYAAPVSPVRSTDRPRELSPDLRIAIARTEKDAAAGRTTARLHALGVALILDGRLDGAIAALEDAASQAPQDAAVLSDLAGAYLARARAASRADDLARGLDAAERVVRAAQAAQQEPAVEALFNRALLLEGLALRAQARDAWNEYLARDNASPWAAEAREHLQQLGASSRRQDDWEPVRQRLAQLSVPLSEPDVVATQFTQDLREYVQTLLLGWGKRVHAASTHGREALSRESALAAALARATGDRLLADAVAKLERGHTSQQAEGLAVLAEGRRASERFEFTRARPLYNRAASLLADNPMGLWARFFSAQALYYARDLDPADAELAAIERASEAQGYLALRGRVRWLRGLIRIDRGRFAEGGEEYRAASALFERAREWDNRANVMSLIADSVRVMGDYRSSWAYRLPVLERVPLMRDAPRAAGALLASALLAESQGLPFAAIVFQNAAEAALRPGAAPAALVQVLLRRAASRYAVGDKERAAADLDAARDLLPKIADAGVSRRLDAERLSLSADLHDPATADQELTSAVQLSTQAGLVTRVPRLLLKRARVRRALGDTEAARKDLLEGVTLFERSRGFAPAAALRVSYFDESWVLFTELIDLARAQGDVDAAFEHSERGRSRWLRDQLQGTDEQARDRTRIRAQMPGDTRLLYFTILPGHLLTWVLWRGGDHLEITPVSGAALVTLAQQYSALLESSWPSASLPAVSEQLFAILVRPVQRLLPSGVPLIVVPDPQIGGISFAALRDRDGTYLLERHPIGYAPAAHVLLAALEASATRAAGAVRVGVVATGGSPRAELAAATMEVEAIARAMPQARIWSGPEATPARFLQSIAEDDIVHFSGHAVANPEFAGLSHLEFGPGTGGTRQLLAGDVATAARARLVVLGACSTAAGAISRGEGVMGLSRPIMAAGVPTVVATLWDVEDAAAAAVFAEFYRGLARQEDSLHALQRAQLQAMMHFDPGRRDPRRWAAFAAIGAPFTTGGTAEVRATSSR